MLKKVEVVVQDETTAATTAIVLQDRTIDSRRMQGMQGGRMEEDYHRHQRADLAPSGEVDMLMAERQLWAQGKQCKVAV